MLKKSIVWLLTLCLAISMVTVSVLANEALDNGSVTEQVEYPNADVTVLSPITLTAADGYYVYDGSLAEGTTDRPLQIVMNFKANDTLEEAMASGYGRWKCDFYLTFSGLANGSVVADNCYFGDSKKESSDGDSYGGNYGQGSGGYNAPGYPAPGSNFAPIEEEDAQLPF